MISPDKALELVADLSAEQLAESVPDAFLRRHFLPTRARGEDQPEDLYVALLQTPRRPAVIAGAVRLFGILMPSLVTDPGGLPPEQCVALDRLMTLVDIAHPDELKARTESLLSLVLDPAVSPLVRDPVVRAVVGYARGEDDARHWQSGEVRRLAPAYAFRALLQIDPLHSRVEAILGDIWLAKLRGESTVNAAFLMAAAVKARGTRTGFIARVLRRVAAELPEQRARLRMELERYPWSQPWVAVLDSLPAKETSSEDKFSSIYVLPSHDSSQDPRYKLWNKVTSLPGSHFPPPQVTFFQHEHSGILIFSLSAGTALEDQEGKVYVEEMMYATSSALIRAPEKTNRQLATSSLLARHRT